MPRLVTVGDVASELKQDKPLLLVDADEVVLRFIDTLRSYFETRGARLGNRGFKLFGNVEDSATGDVLDDAVIKALLKDTWQDRASRMDPVPGAAEALEALSKDWSVVILTNVPIEYAQMRVQNLLSAGMPYPVIANADGKGPAVRTLTETLKAPSAFVDDLPPQHTSVAKHAPETHRIHYIYSEEFGAMIGRADDAHVRLESWPDIRSHLEQILGNDGR